MKHFYFCFNKIKNVVKGIIYDITKFKDRKVDISFLQYF